MIVFLYGTDSYRSKQKLDEIVESYKKSGKSRLNLIDLDAKESNFGDFYGHFKISPMFAEKKLIILKNIFSNKVFQEDFLPKIKELDSAKDVVVVYEKEDVDQRLSVFKSLTRHCKSQRFELLDGRGLKSWAEKEFEKWQQKINVESLNIFLAYVGNDLWRASGEIKKLSDFKRGYAIRKEDIELMVKPKIEVEIFKTIDSLAQKNKKQALAFLQRHLENGDSPLYVLSMIAYQFKNLLLVKELAQKGLMYASIVKKSGLHPFVVKKSYFLCSQFSFEELKNIYQKIFQIDLDIKRGIVESETAVNLLVSQI